MILQKGYSKEKIMNLCEKNNLNEMEENILVWYYHYRWSITKISYKINYSYDNTWLLKKKALEKILIM